MTVTIKEARRVHEFWFGVGPALGRSRAEWFSKDVAFDEAIRARFGALYDHAVQGDCDFWLWHPRTCLALIVLLDQFPRNLFRASPLAFSSDPQALIAARHAVAQGYDRFMLPVERQFCYLPFEHSETLADQQMAERLMSGLTGFPETADALLWARKHREVIERFGRFPHRNDLLHRVSTPEEAFFLTQPGSRF